MTTNRLDRGIFIAPVMAGVALSGFAVALHPTPGGIAEHYSTIVLDVVGFLIAFSALMILVPTGMGSKNFFPNVKRKTCYRLEIVGCVLLFAILSLNAFVTQGTLLEQFTLNDGASTFTGIIQICCLRMIWALGLSLIKTEHPAIANKVLPQSTRARPKSQLGQGN